MCTSIPIISRVSLSWHNGLAVLLILSITTSAADFTIVPQMSVVAAGATASFRCRHQNQNIFWLVNGTELIVGINLPPGITIGISNSVSTLNIVGRLEYSRTLIQCGAFNTNPLEITPNITLLVQGPLSQVSNITRTSSTISWNQPTSLNLTNIEPDIIYCVEVYNITCGRGSLLVSDCSVTESRLVDESLQSGCIYNITITPRSNVVNASNGTSLTKEENFVFLNEPTITLQYAASSDKVRVGINLILNKTAGSVEPTLYILALQSADSITDSRQLQAASSTTTDSSTVALDVSQPLPERRLWECHVFAFYCDNHPISIPFELSTHEFQNISVTSLIPGEIAIAGDFIAGSEARGILIITHAINNDSITNYTFIPRSMIGERRVMGLSSNQYSVSVFIVEGNGLPFNKTATRPQVISVIGTGQNQKSLIDFKLDHISNHVCITCTFLDSAATSCVAVVHQRISQLNSSGLMNIESSHKFSRLDNNTAYGCINEVNSSDHQIGVFGLIEQTVASPSDSGLDPGVIAGIVLGVLIVVALVIVIIFLVPACKKHKKSAVSPSHSTPTSHGPLLEEHTYGQLVHNLGQLPKQDQSSAEDHKESDPVYSKIGQSQSKTSNPSSESAEQTETIDYASLGKPVTPSLFTRGMMPDDPLKVEYKQILQQESPFTLGPENVDDVERSSYDDALSSSIVHTPSTFNDSAVNIFNAAPDE